MSEYRSDCPLARSLELFGDKWSLLIVRDVIISNKTTFKEFIGSPEGIASNILTSRLKKLVANNILVKVVDPNHPKKVNYYGTAKAEEMMTIIQAIVEWCGKYENQE